MELKHDFLFDYFDVGSYLIVNETTRMLLKRIYYFSSLKRGDHLAVQGRKLFLKYLHHGIYLGTSMKVADFGSDSYTKSDAQVRKIDIFEFKGNRRLFKFIYPDGSCNAAEAAAHLSEEAVDMPEIWGPYNVLKNNCEHFATKCKTGRPYSIQVEDVKKVFEKSTEADKSAKSSCILL